MAALLESAIRLTAEQRAAVEHRGGRLHVTGGAGTGKSTALVARFLRLATADDGDSGRPKGVVVLCPTRAAADRFLQSALGHLGGGFDVPPVTTPWGLAHDLVSRHTGDVSLLTAGEQREEVARLLAADGPSRWPSSATLLGRRAFVDEVAAAVSGLQASSLDDDEVVARTEAAGDDLGGRWRELVAFAARYRSALGARGMLDATGLLVAARQLLARPEVAEVEVARLGAVLVDDAHLARPAALALVDELGNLGVAVTTASDADVGEGVEGGDVVDVVRLTHSFRTPEAPTLVRCSHPAVEPEAVAGELLAAAADGVAWSQMAVLVRSAAGGRAVALSRALARHGIPATPLPGPAADEPVVAAVVDVLRWVNGDAGALDRLLASPIAGLDPGEVRTVRRQAADAGIPLESHPRLSALSDLRHHLVARAATATPADLVFEVWQRSLAHLAGPGGADGGSGDGGSGDGGSGDGGSGDGAGDDRSLDAVVALVDGMAQRAERHPDERLAGFLARHQGVSPPVDPWRAASVTDHHAVTIASIAGAAGREWHTVVVAGCVEGELPRIRNRGGWFDLALLEPGDVPGPAERRRRALGDERALFGLATSRATQCAVATAAPEPGVLLSRFVEAWPTGVARLPLAPGPVPVRLPPTVGLVPAFPDGTLRLSASQLGTYDDCPLRYSYEYVVGARSEVGVHARLGTLVHEVLAAFCDPSATGVDRTRHGLLALAEEHWRDDIARFRPQVEEARRDYFAMLGAWWEEEGSRADLASEVLAVERRFEVDVGPHRLTGFIDRIDRADRVEGADDGDDRPLDGAGIRIVDYKTGKSEPSAGDVADDLQLAVYHLAASRDPELVVLGRPRQLRLLYLRSMRAHEQPITPEHEAHTEARVLATAGHILAEEFEPSVDANCRLCSFHRLCPLQPEGRAVTEAG